VRKRKRRLQPGKAGRRERSEGSQESQHERAAGQLSRVIDDIDLVYTLSTHPDIIHTPTYKHTHKHTQNDGFPLSISPRQGLRDRLRRQGPSPSTYTATKHSRNNKLIESSLYICRSQAPVQITSLSGTYATSTYLAAAKKSQKELESVASGLQSIEKKLKDDQKTAEALSECRTRVQQQEGSGTAELLRGYVPEMLGTRTSSSSARARSAMTVDGYWTSHNSRDRCTDPPPSPPASSQPTPPSRSLSDPSSSPPSPRDPPLSSPTSSRSSLPTAVSPPSPRSSPTFPPSWPLTVVNSSSPSLRPNPWPLGVPR
jgi:hypothetical protein